MNSYVHKMHLGCNLGFAYYDCRKCGEETLHRSLECVICHTVHSVATPGEASVYRHEARKEREWQMRKARESGAKRARGN